MEHPHAKFGLKLIISALLLELVFFGLAGIMYFIFPQIAVIPNAVALAGSLLAAVIEFIGFYRIAKESIGFRTAFEFQIAVISIRGLIFVMNIIGHLSNVPWLLWTQSSIDWLVSIVAIIMFYFIVKGCYEITGEQTIRQLGNMTLFSLIGAGVLNLACKVSITFELAVQILTWISAALVVASSVLYILLLVKTYKEVS